MNASYIISTLQAAGMSLAGAIGTWSNIDRESGGNPQNVEDRSGLDDAAYTRMVDAGGYDFETDNGRHFGYGIAQWTAGPRKRKLLEFCRKWGKSVGDLDAQLAFLPKEMREDFPLVWAVCQTGEDPGEVAAVVCRLYEIPANTEAKARDRAAHARAYAGKNQTQDLTEKFWPPRMLCKGMKGLDVSALQSLLCSHGYTVTAVNGVFDDSTEKALRKFQEDHGLEVDGIVGNNSWKALLEFSGVRR